MESVSPGLYTATEPINTSPTRPATRYFEGPSIPAPEVDDGVVVALDAVVAVGADGVPEGANSVSMPFGAVAFDAT